MVFELLAELLVIDSDDRGLGNAWVLLETGWKIAERAGETLTKC
jgi:hypothetical protein